MGCSINELKSKEVINVSDGKRLGFVKAQYRSAAGVIKSEWHYDGDTWTWTFTIPEGATASVTLPGETTTKEYTAGTYTVKK